MSIEEKYYDDDQKKLETKTERYDNTMVRSRVEFYTDGKTVAAVYEGNRDGDGVVEEYRSKGIKRARYHIQFTGSSYSLRGSEQFDRWGFGKSTRWGKANGAFRFYHSNGKVALEGKAVDGKLEGKCTAYHTNGEKRVTFNYNDGKVVDGKYTVYRDNGEEKEEIWYKDGKSNGSYTSYHKGGHISEITKCKDGVKDGSYEKYDRKGKKIHDGIYQGGQRTIVNRYNGYKGR